MDCTTSLPRFYPHLTWWVLLGVRILGMVDSKHTHTQFPTSEHQRLRKSEWLAPREAPKSQGDRGQYGQGQSAPGQVLGVGKKPIQSLFRTRLHQPVRFLPQVPCVPLPTDPSLGGSFPFLPLPRGLRPFADLISTPSSAPDSSMTANSSLPRASVSSLLFGTLCMEVS